MDGCLARIASYDGSSQLVQPPQDGLAKIGTLPLKGRVRIMNVWGGHERAITLFGLRSVLSDAVALIPGPGCPVCVCPEEDVYRAI